LLKPQQDGTLLSSSRLEILAVNKDLTSYTSCYHRIKSDRTVTEFKVSYEQNEMKSLQRINHKQQEQQ
jgi:hypothetical protein